MQWREDGRQLESRLLKIGKGMGEGWKEISDGGLMALKVITICCMNVIISAGKPHYCTLL